jgi:hypothetical protein
MLTDSSSLFEAMARFRRTKEGRLMIDLYSMCEAYRSHDLDNIALIRSEHNYADDLTKLKGNGALLRLLKGEQVSHPVVRYVRNAWSNSSL